MTDPIAHARSAPGGRPPWFVPLLNPFARLLLRGGLGMGPNALVTIRGRTSGLPRTTPLAIIEDSGRRWVWSPWGEVHWARNLRAAGHAAITVRRRTEDVRATELDAGQRVAFFRDTLEPLSRRMPFGVQFVRIIDGVDVNDPEAAAEGRVVFELHP
jgi:deazaflavin-dependent oxidoreductase (nitroreductase family)